MDLNINKTTSASQNQDADATQIPEPHTFKERIAATKKTRWWRFGIVAAIYVAWVIWLDNYWFLLGLPLLFDIYITGYIPFTWWKKSKNKTVRSLMSWVDAIVYALVLVYFIFAFVGQNYQIPSASLEKTLLTGDYLWVNKMVYGPRVPMTPINFPLVHNTMPFVGGDSYLDWPENGYRRLKGLRNVETGDIVVFNFPAGDTVATKYEESPEYYELLIDHYGWGEVNTNTEKFGEVKYRPVDRRTNFVKRAVGLPGQRLKIVDDIIYIDGKAQQTPKNAQFEYAVALRAPLTDDRMHQLGIANDDVYSITDPEYTDALAMQLGVEGTSYWYMLPMTNQMIETLRTDKQLVAYAKASQLHLLNVTDIFPAGVADAEGWSLSNYGGNDGILIPKKGMTVPLTQRNWLIYKRVIRNYEGHTNSYWKDGKAYVDGKEAKNYTFAMDYYFMMGDNRDNSQDSRFWGFVPEDHIVGTPMIVLASFDKDRSLLNGGIRWNRILRDANPDK